MANEIRVLRTQKDPAGRKRHEVIYLRDITANTIKDSAGGTVVAQSSNALSASDRALLNAAELAAIDAGTMLWSTDTVQQSPNETNANFLARVQAGDYVTIMNMVENNFREMYALRGIARDA